jgi:hypothetical protein
MENRKKSFVMIIGKKYIKKDLLVWCDEPPGGSGDLYVCRISC